MAKMSVDLAYDPKFTHELNYFQARVFSVCNGMPLRSKGKLISKHQGNTCHFRECFLITCLMTSLVNHCSIQKIDITVTTSPVPL